MRGFGSCIREKAGASERTNTGGGGIVECKSGLRMEAGRPWAEIVCPTLIGRGSLSGNLNSVQMCFFSPSLLSFFSFLCYMSMSLCVLYTLWAKEIQPNRVSQL